eukprot:TRINITY_DN10209_c0_g1_i1.p3 TRINITY_DN10209_c0_g1~~TRINITY_DN10209_c0_g1_i1.p3  ORF type:complete len:222 (+),score=80.79 TRINITY_DN10209_c0_g1_i1:74-667(+)
MPGTLWQSAGITPQGQNTWLRWPLVLLALAVGGYPAVLGTWNYFHWHPLFMMLAFVALAGNAALLKKIPGKWYAQVHGYMMCTAFVAALLGWYFIYNNKEMRGKQHLTTYHALFGVGVLGGYAAMSVLGYVLLDPNTGLTKQNATVRFLHKMTGRVLTITAWATCWYGFVKVQRGENEVLVWAFGAVLIVLAAFVFL